ncbi:MAG TPA: cytochrome c oxidase subunit II [Chthoniobacterales bacterium]
MFTCKRALHSGKRAWLDAKWHKLSALLLVFLIVGAHYAVSAEPTLSESEKTQHRIADMFQPLSKPAEMIHDVSLVTLAVCAIIFVIVTGMLAYVVIKFRKPANDDGQEPPQIYGSRNIELAWTVIPILITIVLAFVTTRTIGEIQDAVMPENALRVRVVGHQWWWEVHYYNEVDGKKISYLTTANEIHVPVSGKDPAKRIPTHITLQSADVIHSFWVPQLAGKIDLVPNRDNEMWIEPYATGTFFGNCAEYCGTQHANMLLRVIVQTPEEFAAWKAEQLAPNAAPQTAQEVRGHQLYFDYSCVNCHKIEDSESIGVFGPDLNKMFTRQTLGAGVAPMDEKHLKIWVKDPQVLKVGCLMPDMQLLDNEVNDIVAYLKTLK